MNNCQFFARATVEICRIFHIEERDVVCLSRKRETSMNVGGGKRCGEKRGKKVTSMTKQEGKEDVTQ